MRFLIAFLTVVFSLAACAEGQQGSSAYKAGQHFDVLSTPVRTKNPNKIEVTEVFWYGCGHCFHFEPIVHKWAEEQADDVLFQQSPAIWNKTMELHAKAYYAAASIGVLDKLHMPIFNALNRQRVKLNTEESLAELASANGVDGEKYKKTLNSFGVTSQVKQAEARAKGYKITGTPEVIVNGKYRVSTRMTGSQEEMLNVAGWLVKQIRAGAL